MTDPIEYLLNAIGRTRTPDPDLMRALVNFLNPGDAPAGEGRLVALKALTILGAAYRRADANPAEIGALPEPPVPKHH